MSTHQFSLFVPPVRPQAAPAASPQAKNLARVTGRIGSSVLRFCRARVGKTFHAADLAGFVSADCGGAPGSGDRVMRQLRLQGVVDVELVDRAASLYRVVGVSGAAAAEGSWPGT